MIPDNRLSSYPVPAALVGSDKFPITDTLEYEEGPFALQDVSRGLQYQIWRVRLIGESVYVTSPTTPETEVFSKRGITQVSLSFDQNARYVVAYIINNSQLWLYWYSPVLQSFTHTQIDDGVRDVRITMPDKRDFQIPESVIGMFYTKGDKLLVRWQTDRYGDVQELQSGIAGRLMRVGMNAHYRLQFIFQAQPYETYSCTRELLCL